MWPSGFLFPSPACGLRDSRILCSHCKGISLGHGGELLPPESDGLGTRFLVIAVPTTEARDDPGEPSQGVERVGIFLTRGAAFEGWADGFGGLDGCGVCDIGGGPRTSISGINELDVAHGSRKSHGGEFEQAGGLFDLSFFQAQ